MNKRRIFWTGIIVSGIGAGLGLVLATLFSTPYTSKPYRNLERIYIIVGAAGGLILGSSQEAVRQLKEERDAEELLRQRRKASRLKSFKDGQTNGEKSYKN